MTYVIKDRVKVNSTSTGTGNIILGSAVSGFQHFNAIGNNQTYYSISDGTNWELGQGTFQIPTYWSNLFDGTGDYLTLPSSTLYLFPGNFTIEGWMRFTSIPSNPCNLFGITTGTEGFDVRYFGGNGNWQISFNSGSGTNMGSTPTPVINTWYHVAAVRSSGSVRLYVNGIFTGTTISNSLTLGYSNQALGIGGDRLGNNTMFGFLSNVRMTKSALYSGTSTTSPNFTVPTAPLTDIVGTVLLTCQSSTFVDNGAFRTVTAFGNVTANSSIVPFDTSNILTRDVVFESSRTTSSAWSVYFDGNGDNISTPTSSNLGLESNDFTIEFWYNPTARSQSFATLINNGDFNSNRWQINDRHDANNTKVAFHVWAFSSSNAFLVSTTNISNGTWYHVAVTRSGSTFNLYVNGNLEASGSLSGSISASSNEIYIGRDFSQNVTSFNGHISNVRIVKGSVVYTSNFTPPTSPLTAIPNTVLLTCQNNTFLDNSNNNFTISTLGNSRTDSFNPFSINKVDWGSGTKEVSINFLAENTPGGVPQSDNNSISSNLVDWYNLKKQLDRGVINEVPYNNNNTGGVVSTYSLILTSADAYAGGVLAPNGDIHFVPFGGARGQRISSSGVVSTYSLVYTTSFGAHSGGVLAPNGNINFIPNSGIVGQRISSSGVVSTYSLVYTTSNAYAGGVLAPNGDILFIPNNANRGQKVSATGVVSTYSLVYTVANNSAGGVLAPNGDIHFIPLNAVVGQKVSASGVVSTYSLVYTTSNAYFGGVLAPNGDIHFIPYSAGVGQKIDINGIVSTYFLVYTTTAAYACGVLAPNGDIHFVPHSAIRGQKISASGVVSTYSLLYTTSQSYQGGILAPNGAIHFIPRNAAVGQSISTGVQNPIGYCLSPFFNKM